MNLMRQKPQTGRLTSGGINHVIHHEQTFLIPNEQKEYDPTPRRSVQPIKMDTYEKPQKKKSSKYQRK